MGVILNLETSSTNCSVCLAKDGVILAMKELNSENYSHAEKLHVFIEDVMKEAALKMEALEAIAVSKGPGSYTGLRIGVSAAKGLCQTKAEIINELSFEKYISSTSVHFLGSGAEKIKGIFKNDNLIFHLDVVPSAKEMASISFRKFKNKDFENVAYFEPYYLKDFVLQTKKETL